MEVMGLFSFFSGILLANFLPVEMPPFANARTAPPGGHGARQLSHAPNGLPFRRPPFCFVIGEAIRRGRFWLNQITEHQTNLSLGRMLHGFYQSLRLLHSLHLMV
jgi:hypothetical protein